MILLRPGLVAPSESSRPDCASSTHCGSQQARRSTDDHRVHGRILLVRTDPRR